MRVTLQISYIFPYRRKQHMSINQDRHADCCKQINYVNNQTLSLFHVNRVQYGRQKVHLNNVRMLTCPIMAIMSAMTN